MLGVLLGAAMWALIVLAFLWGAQTAGAHRYNIQRPVKAEKLVGLAEGFRVRHTRGWLWVDFAAMSVAANVNLSNYHEARWTTRVGGVPYQLWAHRILPAGSVTMIGRHCHGQPWSPRRQFHRWMGRSLYRGALLTPTLSVVGARAVEIHRHQGAWAGRGHCWAYYLTVGVA